MLLDPETYCKYLQFGLQLKENYTQKPQIPECDQFSGREIAI